MGLMKDESFGISIKTGAIFGPPSNTHPSHIPPYYWPLQWHLHPHTQTHPHILIHIHTHSPTPSPAVHILHCCQVKLRITLNNTEAGNGSSVVTNIKTLSGGSSPLTSPINPPSPAASQLAACFDP